MNYFKFNKFVFDRASVCALGFSSLVLLAIWSFFEASFWFVAPDLLISIFCFLAPKKYKKFIFVSLIFSLIGGIFYYLLNMLYFEQITIILYNTPFVSVRNIVFVSELFNKYGVWGAFFQSFTLIPFKIWTNLVFVNNFNIFVYFVIVMISRLIRFSLFGYIAILLRKKIDKFVENNFVLLFFVYIIIFFSFMFILEA